MELFIYLLFIYLFIYYLLFIYLMSQSVDQRKGILWNRSKV